MNEKPMKIDDRTANVDAITEKESIVYHKNGYIEHKVRNVVREHFIDLVVNEQLVAKLVCTPQNLKELIIGKLVAEGYIHEINDLELCYICEYGSRARVFLKDNVKLVSEIQQEPTCCTDNQTLLKNLSSEDIKPLPKAVWKPEWIFTLSNQFAQDNVIHKETQGTHGCYLSVKGQIKFQCEDIGRHNALEKAIGYAVIKEYQRDECMLYTTGRVPTDMIKKVVTAGIPILVSKSVPTKEALEMAQHYNLTLICRAWPDTFEVFND